MGAPAEVLEEIFTVIEGGQSIGTSAEIIQFPSDNGARTFDVVNKIFKGSNGTGINYWVSAVMQGASAISAGALFVSVTIPEFLALAVPCLGIAVGTAFYNIDPEGWTNLALLLSDAGWTVKNKVVGFMTEKGILNFPPETIQILIDELTRLGAFDNSSEWNGDKPAGFSVVEEIKSSDSTIPVPTSFKDLYWVGNVTVPMYFYYLTWGVPIVENHPDLKVTSASTENGLTILACSKTGFSAPLYGFRHGEDGLYLAATVFPMASYSFTYAEQTVHFIYHTVEASTVCGSVGTNPANFEDYDIIKELAWVIQYGEFMDAPGTKYQQKGAILPNPNVPFNEIYPGWIPFEFPPLPGWTIPEAMPAQYPDLLPTTTEPYQAPAQNPDADPDAEAEKGLDKLTDPNSDPNNNPTPSPSVPDPDPVPEPGEPTENPTGTETPTEPIDPDPTIPPSPPIIIPPLPDTVDSNKLFTVYNPTSSQLDSLGGYLWDNDLIDILKKIWQNPLDGIISLSQVYATPVTGSNHNIILGYLDSGVSARVVTQQFVTIDCGSVTLPELNENCLDYVPYTQIQIYLPFVGIVELDANEFMSGTVSVKYKVDVYTGSCLAEVKCTRTRDLANSAILYTFTGNCSQQLPLTSGDAKGLFTSLLAGAGLVAGIATGGATAASFGSGMSALMSREMLHVGHSGNLSANAGIMGQKKPYLIIGRERPYNANSYNKFYGFPANKSVFPGNHSGFLRLKAGRLRSLATEEEKKEIMELMMKGVIM